MMDRQNLFKRLRQMRLIQFNSNDSLESGESWLRIHPMVLGFVGDDVLQGLRVDDADELQENVDAYGVSESDKLSSELEELLEN